MNIKHAILAFTVVVTAGILVAKCRSGDPGATTGDITAVGPGSAIAPGKNPGRMGPRRVMGRAEVAALVTKRRESLKVLQELPDVLAWEEKFPGFYEQFRPAVDIDPGIRAAARKCNLMLPLETTDIEYTIGLTFTPVSEGEYAMTDVAFSQDGAVSEEYAECIRQSYRDADIRLTVPGGPSVLQVKTFVRMYFKNQMTPAEFREFINKLYDELADVTDPTVRQLYVEQIDYFECIERLGRQRAAECMPE